MKIVDQNESAQIHSINLVRYKLKKRRSKAAALI